MSTKKTIMAIGAIGGTAAIVGYGWSQFPPQSTNSGQQGQPLPVSQNAQPAIQTGLPTSKSQQSETDPSNIAAAPQTPAAAAENKPGTVFGLPFSLPTFQDPNSGWILEQSSPFMGHQTAWMSPAGCKIMCKQLDFCEAVRVADWKVSVYNMSQKVCYETTFEDLIKQRQAQQKSVMGIGKALGEKDNPYYPGKTAVIAGLNARQYVTHSGRNKVDAVLEAYGEKPEPAGTTEIWITQDIPLPARFIQMQRQSKKSDSGLPSNGIMLRMVSNPEPGKHLIIFDTHSVRKAQIDPAIFAPPQGYKPAQSEMAVMLGADAGGAMADLFKEFAKPEVQKETSDVFDEGKRSAAGLRKLKEQYGAGGQ